MPSSALSVIARLPRYSLGRDAAVRGESRIETDENDLYAERFRLEFDLHRAEFFRRRLAQRLADVRYFTH